MAFRHSSAFGGEWTFLFTLTHKGAKTVSVTRKIPLPSPFKKGGADNKLSLDKNI
jgi:hypothetical protein